MKGEQRVSDATYLCEMGVCREAQIQAGALQKALHRVRGNILLDYAHLQSREIQKLATKIQGVAR